MLIAPTLLRSTSSYIRHASSKSASSSRCKSISTLVNPFPFKLNLNFDTDLARQKRDPFVRSRDTAHYVSRSAFKLIELDDKYRFLSRGGSNKSSLRVVDLGASPGGWTQVILERISKGGHVFAADLLGLDEKVFTSEGKQMTVFKGDFTEQAFQLALKTSLDTSAEEKDAKVDVILSDMMGESPNTVK